MRGGDKNKILKLNVVREGWASPRLSRLIRGVYTYLRVQLQSQLMYEPEEMLNMSFLRSRESVLKIGSGCQSKIMPRFHSSIITMSMLVLLTPGCLFIGYYY